MQKKNLDKLAKKVKNQVDKLVSENIELISMLYDESMTIDEFYSLISQTEITVKGSKKFDNDKIRSLGDAAIEKTKNNEYDDLTTREEYTAKFEDALLYHMGHRIEAEKKEGEIEETPKEYKLEEQQAIKQYIRIAAKDELDHLRYMIRVSQCRGEGYGLHLALNQALASYLDVPEDIKNKYGVTNLEEFKTESVKKMNELIYEYIKECYICLGNEFNEETKDKIHEVSNFFISQISEVSKLQNGSEEEKEFLSKIYTKLSDLNLTPFKTFFAHLYRAARSIPLGNTLNMEFVDFVKTENTKGVEPIFLQGIPAKSTEDHQTDIEGKTENDPIQQ